MNEMTSLDALKRSVSEIGNQMSTGINVSDIRRKLVPRQNILDNWYFVGGGRKPVQWNGTFPVNQRGVSGTITAIGYFIDRWKLVSGTVTIRDDGLLLDGTLQQVLENSVGHPTIATALTADGQLIECEYDDSLRVFQITASGKVIIATKLEVGDTQSLARQNDSGEWVLADIAPNYSLELIQCKRYLYYQSAGAIAGLHVPAQQYVYLWVFTGLTRNPTLVYNNANIYSLGTRTATSGYSTTTLNKATSCALQGYIQGLVIITFPATAFSNTISWPEYGGAGSSGTFNPIILTAEL